jgi:hypothetical protein
MRVLARIGCTLAGLALLAPAVAWAGQPMPTTPPKKKKAAKSAKAEAPKKLCANCRYRQMLAQGLRVPPPPALPPGAPARGEKCTECGAPTAVVADGKLYQSYDPNGAPGRAVAGGNPAGYMVEAGGPAPIGVVAPRIAAAVVPPGAAMRDAAVMPTVMASDPLTNGPSGRPHVLSHMFGLSAIGRERAEARARRKEEAHARIPYGVQQAGPVTDLPASAVYGR